MNTIELAREIGKSIQKEDCYIKLQIAKQQSDDDAQLQQLIGAFNLKRMAINNEASKEDRDDEKMQELNKDMREVYTQIMQNENMLVYNAHKQEMDALLQKVIAIITQSSEGQDPETTEYAEGCSGSCSGCSGCH